MILAFSSNLHYLLELLDESHVVFIEVTNVIDSVLQHCDSLYTHTYRKTGILVGVDTASLMYVRMGHAAAQNFNPAAAFADRTALAAAFETRNIHFRTRLGEREVTRTELGSCLRTKELFRHMVKRPL